jgi:Rrf2 family protein
MLFSLSTTYAIRACTYLARAPAGGRTVAREISAEEDIPAHFLAKILQELVRSGLLASSRGPTGGFGLRVPADKISLLDMIDILEGPQTNPDEPAVAMHDGWRDLRVQIGDYLRQTTIADLAACETNVSRRRLRRRQVGGAGLHIAASAFEG